MELTINHQKKNFDQLPASLAALVQHEHSGSFRGLAVALNKQMVPKSEWTNTFLQDKDSILIITATQGG